jgi:hypothetical protein
MSDFERIYDLVGVYTVIYSCSDLLIWSKLDEVDGYSLDWYLYGIARDY